MKRQREHSIGELWLLSLLIGLGLISYPFIEIFNKDTLIAGFPLLFIYFSIVWPLYIVVVYLFSRRFKEEEKDKDRP